MLEIKNLEYSIEKDKILKDISLKIKKGEFVGIIGPNGSGKSTLLKSIYGAIEKYKGNIELKGKDIKELTKKERAKNIAVLAQEEEYNFDFLVEEVVEMGRYPYKSIFEGYSKDDRELSIEMLEKVGMKKYIGKSFKNLSGGEKQRVLIARALTQQSEILILDEPTNHLDISSQLQILHMITHLNLTVIAVLHDLNITALFCTYIYVMKNGEIRAHGKVEDILTEELIEEVFGVKCYIGKNPLNNKLHISYMPTHYHIDGVGSDHFHEDGFTGEHTHN